MSKRRGKSAPKSDILTGMTVTLSGKFSLPRGQFIRLIEEHGATVIINVTKRVTHIITTPEDARAKTIRIQQALKYDLPLIDEAFIHDSIEAGHKLNEEDYVISIGKGPNGKKVPLQRPVPRVKPSDSEAAPSEESSILLESPLSTPVSKRPKRRTAPRPSPQLQPARSKRHISDLGLDTDQPLKIIKRTPMVDPYAMQPEYVRVEERKARVVEAGMDCVYDVMLRLPGHDYDEFFIMQVIATSHQSQTKYLLYTRAGIAGTRGEVTTKYYKGKDKAVKEFEKKFYEKTLNNWLNRRSFSKARGKYEFVPFGYMKREVDEEGEVMGEDGEAVVHEGEDGEEEGEEGEQEMEIDEDKEEETKVEEIREEEGAKEEGKGEEVKEEEETKEVEPMEEEMKGEESREEEPAKDGDGVMNMSDVGAGEGQVDLKTEETGGEEVKAAEDTQPVEDGEKTVLPVS